MSVSLSEKI